MIGIFIGIKSGCGIRMMKQFCMMLLNISGGKSWESDIVLLFLGDGGNIIINIDMMYGMDTSLSECFKMFYFFFSLFPFFLSLSSFV